jgi:MinD-like ATPase involved in chromosome partitioning or flagellar assembly
MMDAELAIALSAREWPDRLRRFLADHGGARVRLAALGPEDLLSESYDILLIDDSCSFLTPRLVELVSGRGRIVIGVYDSREFADGRSRLVECGVTTVVEAGSDPDEYLRVIAEVASSRRPPEEPPAVVAAGEGDEPPPGSAMVAVGGPAGGPGATEVAVALASVLSRRGATVLVDADDHAPAVAQRLGLPLYPNVRTAIDVLDHRTGPLERTLHRVADAGFLALPGLASAGDWSEVRPRQVTDLIGQLVAAHRHVVVNVGSRLETDGLGVGPGRYGMTRAIVERADRLVAVGAGTPVGVARLLEWLSTADSIRSGRRVDVLVNRAPDERFRRGELLDEITRTYQPASFGYLPDDPRVAHAAWDGKVVSRGRFRKAVDRWSNTFLVREAA